MTFKVEILEKNAIKQVLLTGRLDSTTSLELEKSLQNLFEQAESVALMDFTALDYVSSAGLRIVLMAAKRAKQAKGRLILCGLQPHVKEVFEISGFLKILEVSENLETATTLVS